MDPPTYDSLFYPSIIVNTSLQVPSCNIRNFTQFFAGHNAVNVVCSDIDVDTLSNQIISLTHSLQQQYVALDLRFLLFS